MSQLKRIFNYLKPYTKEAVLSMVFLGLVVVRAQHGARWMKAK